MNIAVWLSSQSGVVKEVLETIVSVRWTKIASKIGWFDIVLPGDFDIEKVEVDAIVEIWRKPTDQVSYREFTGFVRKFRTSTDDGGITRYTISGPCSNELVRRRIVAYASGTAYTTKTDYSDSLLKALVKENLGSSATDADRIMTGVSVEDDLDGGYSLTYSCAWDELEDALKGVSDSSSGYGTDVYWSIVYLGEGAFKLITTVDELGLDRTTGDTITFGLEFGNLSRPDLVIDYSREVTVVYAGGPGEGTTRTIVEVEDAARTSRSQWGRREAFIDERNEPTTAGLTAKANARLDAGMPTRQFTGRLLDTEQARYGAEWGFGDRVLVTYAGVQYTAVVNAVVGKVEADGLEELDVYCEVNDEL